MNEQSVRLKFMVYQDAGLFLSPSQLAGAPMQVVSGGQVVAGSVLGVAVQNLSQPVTSIFSPTKVTAVNIAYFIITILLLLYYFYNTDTYLVLHIGSFNCFAELTPIIYNKEIKHLITNKAK